MERLKQDPPIISLFKSPGELNRVFCSRSHRAEVKVLAGLAFLDILGEDFPNLIKLLAEFSFLWL